MNTVNAVLAATLASLASHAPKTTTFPAAVERFSKVLDTLPEEKKGTSYTFWCVTEEGLVYGPRANESETTQPPDGAKVGDCGVIIKGREDKPVVCEAFSASMARGYAALIPGKGLTLGKTGVKPRINQVAFHVTMTCAGELIQD